MDHGEGGGSGVAVVAVVVVRVRGRDRGECEEHETPEVGGGRQGREGYADGASGRGECTPTPSRSVTMYTR